MNNTQKVEQAVAILELRKLIKAGDTVYTLLKHCSSSGMMRVIDVYVIKKNKPMRLGWTVAKAVNRTYNRRHEGVQVGGCGMDMGFELVYNLGRKLYPQGFKLRKGQYGRNGDTSGFDRDGGYAFEQKWL